MRKIALSLVVVSTFSAYALYQRGTEPDDEAGADPQPFQQLTTPPVAPRVAEAPAVLPNDQLGAALDPRRPGWGWRDDDDDEDDDDDDDDDDDRFDRRRTAARPDDARRSPTRPFDRGATEFFPGAAPPMPAPAVPELPAALPQVRAAPGPGPEIAANLPAGAYRDGQYNGSRADAHFGALQVTVTISNGRIVDIQVPEYPRDRSRSARINQQALPILKREALQVQSASVNIVSGATPTSRAFRESLAAALRAAR